MLRTPYRGGDVLFVTELDLETWLSSRVALRRRFRVCADEMGKDTGDTPR